MKAIVGVALFIVAIIGFVLTLIVPWDLWWTFLILGTIGGVLMFWEMKL